MKLIQPFKNVFLIKFLFKYVYKEHTNFNRENMNYLFNLSNVVIIQKMESEKLKKLFILKKVFVKIQNKKPLPHAG